MKEAIILKNEALGAEFFLISLKWSGARKVRPGQFVMVRVTGGVDPLLRRPFSVYNVRGGTVELLYKVVGKGTRILASLSPGDRVDLLGPLGKGFPVPSAAFGEKGRLLMVAGGVGIAPFYHLAQNITCSALLIFGARTKKDTVAAAGFKNIGVKTIISTEDGSRGVKGLVTDILEREMRRGDIVYGCGPSPMLKAVASLTEAKGIRCLVSLERAMACGIGVCLGCAVKTSPHSPATVIKDDRSYHMVCSDGPVFDSRDVDWDLL